MTYTKKPCLQERKALPAKRTAYETSQTFEFDHDINVEVAVINGEPYFAAANVCNVLGYTNPRQTLRAHVGKDVVKHDTLTNGGVQKVVFVNESGLYALIFGSKLPNAKAFKRWVTSEVLPAVRKTGKYAVSAQEQSETEAALRSENAGLKARLAEEREMRLFYEKEYELCAEMLQRKDAHFLSALELLNNSDRRFLSLLKMHR